MTQNICVAEFDDYPLKAERMIMQMDYWHSVNPKFKATLYAIPEQLKMEHLVAISERPWLRLGVHGFKHRRGECRNLSTMFMEKYIADVIKHMPYDRICKPPFYGYGRRYIRLMHENGYAMSCRHAIDLYRYLNPLEIPDVRLYSKHEKPYIRMFGHPNNTPFMFNPRIKRDNKTICESADDFRFTTEITEKMSMIYLGSGEHYVKGFDNLDKCAKGASKWVWGERLPYSDSSVSFVLIQQSIMYAPLEMYPDIFKEIYRVLCTGGRLLVKEDNMDTYIWKPIGRCGVKSHTNPQMMRESVEKCGLTIESTDSLQLLDKYPDLINRKMKVRNGRIYIIEAMKQGGK